MWSTRQELEAVLAQAGLGEWSPRLAGAARHAIVFEPGPVEEGADAPIGASRVGGMPDLHSGVPWPWRPALDDGTYKDHATRPWPLSFVAQIDFAEIRAAGGLEGFPSSGRLLFFYDPIEVAWGQRIEDQASASVMFLTDPVDRLGRRGFPVELSNPRSDLEPSDFMFRPRRLTPKLVLLPPPSGSHELLALLGLDNGPVVPSGRWEQYAHEAYDRFWEALAAGHGRQRVDANAMIQVGGSPFAWLHPVETDCVKYADDDYLSHPTVKAFHARMKTDGAPMDWPDYQEAWQAWSAFEARESATHFARAGSWQLVLQFDDGFIAEDGRDWRFYVCIRKSDLGERRFDRCWTVMQCT